MAQRNHLPWIHRPPQHYSPKFLATSTSRPTFNDPGAYTSPTFEHNNTPSADTNNSTIHNSTITQYANNSTRTNVNTRAAPQLQHTNLNTTADSASLSTTKTDLFFYYQNVRDLRTKLNDLRLTVSNSDFDVWVLTETWLDDSIPSSLITDDSYQIFRCDRNPANSSHSRGGGVLIACSANLSCSVLTHTNASLESLWVCIRLSHRSLYVGVIYIPPDRSSSSTEFDAMHDDISAICERMRATDLLILFGDFNTPSLAWEFPHPSSRHLYPCRSSSSNVALIDGMVFNGLWSV